MVIFIHSMFRTGSTYIWNKFRSNPSCTAYYEPLHEDLLELSKDVIIKHNSCDTQKYLRHPTNDRHYFYEYNKAIDDKGVEYFDINFTANEFCYNGDNRRLFSYITNLIDLADTDNVIFQFNRTALRTEWFCKNFKDAVNVYLVRNPRDTFQSYVSYSSTGNYYFLAMHLIYLSYSSELPVFKWLLDFFKIEFKLLGFNEAIKYYNNLVEDISLESHYLLFYTIWYLAIITASMNVDFVFDINKCIDNSYRREVENKLAGLIDLSDVNCPTYEKYALPVSTFDFIETTVEKYITNYIERISKNA